jgi:hypothetical protein
MKESNLLPRSTYSMPVSVRLMCFNMAPVVSWLGNPGPRHIHVAYIPPSLDHIETYCCGRRIPSDVLGRNQTFLVYTVLSTICFNMATIPKWCSYCLPLPQEIFVSRTSLRFWTTVRRLYVLYHRRHPLIDFFTNFRITTIGTQWS